jgi:Mrp family chromosome partitioning ATPase
MFQLRLDYDLIIIDSPPSAVVSDTHVLTRIADATLFVVKWGQTRQNLAVSEFNTLLSNGCPGGILLNQVDARKMSLHRFSDSGLYSRAYSSTYYKS